MPEVPTILQIGPALSVRGGVSAVEQLIVNHVGNDFAVRHVATMEDGSVWRKAVVFSKALRQLAKELKATKPLVVHVHFASRGSTLRKLIMAWMTLRANRPLVLHAHGACFDEFYNGLPALLQRQVAKIFAGADCFLVLSSQWRDFYTRSCGLPAGRVVVLCNPTAVPASVASRTGRSVVQFLFLGRIGARKGAFDLLQAFATLPEAVRARARLVFAGDGEVEALREQAAPFGDQVEVNGWIDATQRNVLLDASDVFALPSHAEGVPMAMLEAMAYGLPVITTRVGGIPDLIEDRTQGLMIEPGNVAAIRDAMQVLIEDESLRLRLGRDARARAQQCDVNQYSTHLTSIYRRLLATQR
jgi:glycosyltransferase involved in cell wall biosynthesis